jgi:hypothetical protein
MAVFVHLLVARLFSRKLHDGLGGEQFKTVKKARLKQYKHTTRNL